MLRWHTVGSEQKLKFARLFTECFVRKNTGFITIKNIWANQEMHRMKFNHRWSVFCNLFNCKCLAQIVAADQYSVLADVILDDPGKCLYYFIQQNASRIQEPQDFQLLNRFGRRNEGLQGHSGLQTIRLWSKRKYETAVEFLQMIPSISGDIFLGINQLQDRNQIVVIQYCYRKQLLRSNLQTLKLDMYSETNVKTESDRTVSSQGTRLPIF